MKSSIHLSAILLGVPCLIASAFKPVQAIELTEVSKIAKTVTVQIEGQNPGSGVLIHRQGNIYKVLTAAHVVATEDEYEIITVDNQRHGLDYNHVKKFPGIDLALVEFSSPHSYQVANLGNSNEIQSGESVYISGFPMPTAAITNSIFTFSPGLVTANASTPLADGYSLVYNNNTLPGMSGGAVLDNNGKLIGIHGRADSEQLVKKTETVYVKTGFNLGIPIHLFETLIADVAPSLGFTAKVSIPTQTNLTADDWFLKAAEKYKKRDYQGAIADLDQAIQLNPKYGIAYNNRGSARLFLGDSPGAIADHNQAIQLQPDYAKAYFNRGNAKRISKDYQGAISDYSTAIQLTPDDADSYTNRGFARVAIGDQKGARADYDQAIQLSPDHAIAYTNRGALRSQLGDKEGAIADYSKAIQSKPDYMMAYYNRGVIYRQLGKNLQGAIADNTKAIQLQPDLAEAYGNRGLLLIKIGDKQDAIANLKTAARLFKEQGRPKDYDKAMKLIQKISP